jgi:UDP-N-acetylmuramyl pentapeptide phosphotransferase/UDP-N-acetylglucosamine-1-phosphate transferase
MPSMLHPALAAAFACALVAAGIWCNRRWIGWLPDDPPRAGRKQHQRPMPLAGILLAPAALPWLLGAGAFWLLAGFAVAAATGFVDDWQKERGGDFDWRGKALGLGVAAGLAACEVVLPVDAPWRWLAVVLLVFVLTNATNFLDNTDGVATALAATSLLVLGGGGGTAAAIAFAALGFLPWNWPRPRAFLGDAGAYALGLATGVFAAGAALPQPGWLLAVAVQLADFTQVVVARVWLGLPPWVGDRRHLTHIAQNLGLPRWAVAPTFAALALGLGLLALGLAAN